MSQLQRLRSTYEDNSAMTGNSDEESYSDNEGRKSADLTKSKQGSAINKNTDDYKKRRQRNNEGRLSG